MAPEAAEVCAPYQKQATMARTNAGTLAPKVPKDARQHGERHAGFDTGIADKAHECENNKRAQTNGHDEVDEISTEQKQVGGEIAAPQAVYI